MLPESEEQLEAELIECISKYDKDPSRYVDFAFPWGDPETPLHDKTGPRAWQREILNDIRDHLSNPETRFTPCQIAVASGHGIGKSALIGMLIKWGLDTCGDTRIVCTSNTDTQLKTKTVPEVTKWCNMSITSHWFKPSSTMIVSTEKAHEKSWRCDFVPWSKDNSEAFAGLHNEGKRIIVIFDEASGIDDIIWEVTEGALTDANTEIIWIAFGNPTRSTGRFRECFRKFSRFWRNRHIDSRTVEDTNLEQAQKWSDQYGEDSDFMRVRVKGQFPNASAYQFIPSSLIQESKGRHLRPDQYDFAPVILSCDPAWTGDDLLVIGMRQGLYHKILDKIPINDNDVMIANKLARYEDEFDADAVFIDQGWGQGIYSAGQTMGRNWMLIAFGGRSGRSDCHRKRDEMIVSIKEWLEQGGCIDPDDELSEELEAVETLPTFDGVYKFPPKDDMKDILGRSPNCMDQLGLTFAMPVIKRADHQIRHSQRQSKEYNPINERLRGQAMRDRLSSSNRGRLK